MLLFIALLPAAWFSLSTPREPILDVAILAMTAILFGMNVR
jgi:hypothetical protein